MQWYFFLPFNWFSSFEALVALQSNTVFTSSCYCVKTFSCTLEHGDHKPLLRCWNIGELMTPAVVTTLHVGALQSTETSLLWRSFSETLKSRYSSFKTLLIFSIQVLSISTFLYFVRGVFSSLFRYQCVCCWKCN